jgi:hypothetical protein
MRPTSRKVKQLTSCFLLGAERLWTCGRPVLASCGSVSNARAMGAMYRGALEMRKHVFTPTQAYEQPLALIILVFQRSDHHGRVES